MAKKDPKPVLGYIECTTCNKRATVHKQGGQKHRWLYKRCDCGSTCQYSVVAQSQLFYETSWLDGVPEAPPNVSKEALDEHYENQKEKYASEPSKTTPDVVSGEPGITEDEPNNDNKKPFLLAVATGVSICLLALLGRKQ